MWVSSKCTATHFSSDSSQTNDPKMENSTWYFPLHSLGEGCCHSQHLYYDPFSAWPIPRRLKHLNRWMKLMLLLKNKQKQKKSPLWLLFLLAGLATEKGVRAQLWTNSWTLISCFSELNAMDLTMFSTYTDFGPSISVKLDGSYKLPTLKYLLFLRAGFFSLSPLPPISFFDGFLG